MCDERRIGAAPRRRIAVDPLFDRADRPSCDVATLHFNVIAIVIASAIMASRHLRDA